MTETTHFSYKDSDGTTLELVHTEHHRNNSIDPMTIRIGTDWNEGVFMPPVESYRLALALIETANAQLPDLPNIQTAYIQKAIDSLDPVHIKRKEITERFKTFPYEDLNPALRALINHTIALEEAAND